CSGCFNYHTTYGINSRIDNSVLSMLFFIGQGTNTRIISHFTSFYLYQLSKNTCRNLLRRNSPNIQTCWCLEMPYLLLSQSRRSQIGTTPLSTTATTNHPYICRSTAQRLF